MDAGNRAYVFTAETSLITILKVRSTTASVPPNLEGAGVGAADRGAAEGAGVVARVRLESVRAPL